MVRLKWWRRSLKIFQWPSRTLDAEGKNTVLLAAQNRQLFVFQLLLKRNILIRDVFRKADNAGNSALHLAATAMLEANNPCLNLEPALQLQWEIKWFEFVKNSMPSNFFAPYIKKNRTARDIFSESHAWQVSDGGEWLNITSEYCLEVGSVITTVAFATATAFPGGIREATGSPILENQAAFEVFAILLSRLPLWAFGKELPIKYLVGLTTLFLFIISMVVSFCAGHFFMPKDKLKYSAVPAYTIACMPLASFAIIQLPHYCNLIYMIFKTVPYYYRKADDTKQDVLSNLRTMRNVSLN